MWLLAATVCLSLDAKSCETLYYTQQVFINEKSCSIVALEELPKLNAAFVFVNARCIQIPGEPA